MDEHLIFDSKKKPATQKNFHSYITWYRNDDPTLFQHLHIASSEHSLPYMNYMIFYLNNHNKNSIVNHNRFENQIIECLVFLVFI